MGESSKQGKNSTKLEIGLDIFSGSNSPKWAEKWPFLGPDRELRKSGHMGYERSYVFFDLSSFSKYFEKIDVWPENVKKLRTQASGVLNVI